MTTAQWVVTVGGAALVAALAWFFFRPRRAAAAVETGGVQEVRVTVKGGYQPDLIRVRTGVPLRIVFDRQEDGDCSSRVVFPDLALSRFLPPFAETIVEFTPQRAGSFGFACGMNMLHGTLRVEGRHTAVDHGRHRQGRRGRGAHPLRDGAGDRPPARRARARQTS